MILARSFVVISLLAVISSASASLFAPPPTPIAPSRPTAPSMPAADQQQEQKLERYYGPSQFA